MATSAGSILDNGTKASPGVLYYSGGGGGGGGGTSTFVTANVSTLQVSSIASLAGGVPVEFKGDIQVNGTTTTSSMLVSSIVGGDGGFLTLGGDTVFVKSNLGLFFPADGAIVFQDNLGALTGVSSINGASYPPSASLAIQNAPLANGGSLTFVAGGVGGPQPVTGSFATTAGKLYQASIKVTSESLNPPGPPASGGDHYAFVDPTAGVAATRLYTEISSIYGGGQPRGETIYFNFLATGPTGQLSAYTNGGSGQSTLVTLDTTYGCRVVQLN